jgi:hypothetical protein
MSEKDNKYRQLFEELHVCLNELKRNRTQQRINLEENSNWTFANEIEDINHKLKLITEFV